MPKKRASVENEDQYETLKDKGMSKERAARIAKCTRFVQQGWPEVKEGELPLLSETGWHHSPEESSRTQRRKGHCTEAIVVIASRGWRGQAEYSASSSRFSPRATPRPPAPR